MSLSLQPKKSLGQNFLSDPNTARKIVGALRAVPGDPVVEIGPGTGALTGFLLELFENLCALEVDQRAVALLNERWPALNVRHADVLDVNWQALSHEQGGPLHVIGNLPYYITSQILFRLLDAGPCISEAVVMMQLEVAERLVALPRTKAYGILSVAVQLAAQPEILFRVSPNVFFPKPDVTSAVVRLSFLPTPLVLPEEAAFVRRLVRQAFNQRRKTLRNSLAELTREQALVLPADVESRRAEELSPEGFIDLARWIMRHKAEAAA